ncbi:SOS response-associated peptidase [Vibrio alginolyticus]|uniref:SOS response-associated peptidase n=1 Tax=Vibrio alginolyticus TaxID=663 RepID=UPI001A8C786A|nr:SOS response-associated peptidase family protein [Vibrio alginolyticus]MBO0161516.1 SOS response-associated peptidase [Vibrio alginolyticus]
MCGRLNVIDNPLIEQVCEDLGIRLSVRTNTDLCPTELISSIGADGDAMRQLDLSWGIKPSWAKRVLINAQAETVSTKPTFKQSFLDNRVIVPCSGWYEWANINGKKQKYLFKHADDSPIYMAAIALEHNEKVVTLTTKPNDQCRDYHHRMPLLVDRADVMQWLMGNPLSLGVLLNTNWESPLDISLATNVSRNS